MGVLDTGAIIFEGDEVTLISKVKDSEPRLLESGRVELIIHGHNRKPEEIIEYAREEMPAMLARKGIYAVYGAEIQDLGDSAEGGNTPPEALPTRYVKLTGYGLMTPAKMVELNAGNYD